MRLFGICAAVLGSLLVAATAAAGSSDAAACRITSPPGGTGESSQGFNTRLHEGQDTIWTDYRRGVAGNVRPVGRVKAIMLFVDFPNARAEDNEGIYTDTEPYYDYLAPQAERWFNTSSYHRLRFDIDAPRKWYRMDGTDASYGLGWLNPPEVQSRYIQEAVRHADRDVDFSEYDLIHVVPSRNATAIPYSPEWNDYAGRVREDGRTFYNGVTFGADMWRYEFKITVHETFHDFGLPDLYPPPGGGQTIGGWDTMNNLNGPSPDMFAWHKWKLGWLKDSQMRCVSRPGSSTHPLVALEVPGGPKAVVIRTGRYTALVAESRRAIGLDANSCDPGVLIYRLDASVPNGDGIVHVRDTWPGSGTVTRPGLPTCRELDRATLGFDHPDKVSTYTEGDVTIELLWQAGLVDVVRVRKSS
jgi:M6 family metalloprotease-like protein